MRRRFQMHGMGWQSASLETRESEARALMGRLRACGREIERLAARTRARRVHPGGADAEERVAALRAEADHIRVELTRWDVAGSRLWVDRLLERLERLSSAIATAEQPDHPLLARDRIGGMAAPEAEARGAGDRRVTEDVERVVQAAA
jgi:hypothetical protein